MVSDRRSHGGTQTSDGGPSTGRSWLGGEARGQAHTLEAVVAGMVLLASVVFALQVTAVTPLTGSTSSQHLENQQAAVADGLLTAETENGTVKEAVLYWNTSRSRFYGASRAGYTSGGPPTAFGAVLNRSFDDRNVVFNVNIKHVRPNGERRTIQLVHLGEPSDHASVASQMITLYDDDLILNADGTQSGQQLAGADYFARNVDQDSRVYNVVEVEVITWQM